MSKEVKYVKLDYFEQYKRELANKRKESFKLSYTNYTKKIVLDSMTILFNESGQSDMKLLGLINKVRGDAKEYKQPELFGDIKWHQLYKIPTEKEVIAKIDVKSAYWKLSHYEKVISNATHSAVYDLYEGEDVKVMKSARLKALGSLATTKTTETYEKGIHIEELDVIETQKTKETYLGVCQKVDKLMQECASCFPVVYYYWDCIFANVSLTDDIKAFFKDRGFETTVKTTNIVYIPYPNGAKLLSISDDIMYCVSKEDKHFLEQYS